MHRLDIDYIKENLRTHTVGQSLFYFEKLGSTNDKLRELLQGHADEGAVIIAEQQTAGKGREGNSWYSPPEVGLYFSVLFKPGQPAIKMSGLTLALGASIADAIEEFAQTKMEIKWPNDLFLQGRKVGGILTETILKETDAEAVIVGIGINVNNELIPLELCDNASSIYLETGSAQSREGLLVKMLANMEPDYKTFLDSGLEAFRERIEPRFYLNQRWVSVEAAKGQTLKGVATGFDGQGALLLLDGDGQTIRCTAGTIAEIER